MQKGFFTRRFFSIRQTDPQLYSLIQAEQNRQRQSIELIASENFASAQIMETLGTCLTNKYSEGYPGRRYYGGNQIIDQVERLTQQRALKAFNCGQDWNVNVQPLSGSTANMAVYTALLAPGKRIMGLGLADGGHLTHGHKTGEKAVSGSSLFWETQQYGLCPDTQLIDYDLLQEQARDFKPDMIIAGFSAYPRDLDYRRFREICDEVGAFLMADIAHISGLVATGEANNPFEFADVVTSTTHKTLRGPRSGLIFSRKEISPKIDFAVFPMINGGPHNHQIAALATQLLEVDTPEFREYIRAVKRNA